MKNRDRDEAERASQMIRQNIVRLPSFIGKGLGHHIAGSLHTPKPSRLGLRVTSRCNAKCIMCPFWRTEKSAKELTPGEIREVLSSPLFGSLEGVILTGGEPTLREDLAEIAEAILDSRPKIEKFAINTNGMEPSLVTRQVKDISSLCHSRAAEFTVCISLDGCGTTHEKIRRIPHAFERVNETIRLLKELRMQLPFSIHLNCVVQPLNINELPQLSKFAQEIELPIQFFPVYAFDSLSDNDKQQLRTSSEQVEELKIFLGSPQYDLTPMWAAFWQDYFRVLQGERRRFPCALLYHNVSLHADGTLIVCERDKSLVYGNVRDAPIDKIWYSAKAKMMRERVKRNYCPDCTVACDLSFSLGQEFFYFARFLMREEAQKLLRRCRRRPSS
ncbi:MAG: radical SAM protein [Dehalococcoidia bacterium]|nr:radical SAM protein [Dehalococcoidia bacterium]